MSLLVVFSALCYAVAAAPSRPIVVADLPHAAPAVVHAAPVAVVSSQSHAQDELGQYSYSYSNPLSSKVETKTVDGITRGGYAYLDSHGLVQNVNYVSDDVNGFRVAASNLPLGQVTPQEDEPLVAHEKAKAIAALHDAAAQEAAEAAVVYENEVAHSPVYVENTAAPVVPVAAAVVPEAHAVTATPAAYFAATPSSPAPPVYITPEVHVTPVPHHAPTPAPPVYITPEVHVTPVPHHAPTPAPHVYIAPEVHVTPVPQHAPTPAPHVYIAPEVHVTPVSHHAPTPAPVAEHHSFHVTPTSSIVEHPHSYATVELDSADIPAPAPSPGVYFHPSHAVLAHNPAPIIVSTPAPPLYEEPSHVEVAAVAPPPSPVTYVAPAVDVHPAPLLAADPVVHAAPAPVVHTAPAVVHAAPVAVVSSQSHAQDELGQYSYSYSNPLSAKVETKTVDGITRGGYAYLDSHGLVQNVNYVSDDHNGFRVAASNLPTPAVPVDIPDSHDVAAAKAVFFAEIAKAKAAVDHAH